MAKIISLEKLSLIVNDLKKNNKKISLCHGTFDLLHIGHIYHFQESKKISDLLIVSVTADKFVLKGPNRPKFNLEKRMTFLSKIELIDFIVPSYEITAVSNILKIKPNYYCKGSDYYNEKDITNNIKKEIKAVKKFKGKIVYTNSETFSSSNLLNEMSNSFSSVQKKYLKSIKSKYIAEKIINKIKILKNLKILVMGETIIDEYVFCDAIGKSGKEPVLVIQEKDRSKYLGGAAIVANNISKFSNNVELLSSIGDKNSQLEFINSRISKNIKKTFIKKKNSPTINKKRYIDNINKNKILGVYSLSDNIVSKTQEKKILDRLKKEIHKFDIVIALDYGHGFISEKIANLISKKSKYLAVNSQINSSNIGFQRVGKYQNFDLLVINENELRHDFRDKVSPIDNLTKKLISSLNIDKIIVTSGKEGAVISDKTSNLPISCPAFASEVVDKVGAGDFMLSVASLCDAINLPNDIVLFMSSLAAAQSVESVGNSKNLDKDLLLKSFIHLLK